MKDMLKKLSALAVLVSVLALAGCGPDQSSSSPSNGGGSSSSSSSLTTYAGELATYTVIAQPNGTQLKEFGVAEDADALYFYWKLGAYKKGVLLTTVGSLDNSLYSTNNGGPITGTWDWTWADTQRGYGSATNAFEIKVQFANDYSAGTLTTNNFDTGNLQILPGQGNSEMKLMNSGAVDTNIGAVYGSEDVLEVKVLKSSLTNGDNGAMTIPASALNNLCFFVGKWGTWGNDNNASGLIDGEYAPAANVGTSIGYYLKSDGTSVYRGGKTLGSVSYDVSNPLGFTTVAQLTGTNVTVKVVDFDNQANAADISVVAINGTTTNAASTESLSGASGVFSGTLSFVTGSASAGQILIDPAATNTVLFIYADASSNVSVTNNLVVVTNNTVTFEYTNIATNSVAYDGDVAFPNNFDGWNNAAWTVTLSGGAGSADVEVPATQVPNASGGAGQIVVSGAWSDVDNCPSGNFNLPDFSSFDPTTQKIFIDGSNNPITAVITNK